MSEPHPFEAAGLGRGPFRIIRMCRVMRQAHAGAPATLGGRCDLCKDATMLEIHFESTDYKRCRACCACAESAEPHSVHKIKQYRQRIARQGI